MKFGVRIRSLLVVGVLGNASSEVPRSDDPHAASESVCGGRNSSHAAGSNFLRMSGARILPRDCGEVVVASRRGAPRRRGSSVLTHSTPLLESDIHRRYSP